MLFFKRSLKKKILATDGYVEEPLETRIHMADRLGSNVERNTFAAFFIFQDHSPKYTPGDSGSLRKAHEIRSLNLSCFAGDDVRSEERRNHYGIQNRH